jgi:hypothetical protein
VVKGIVLVIVVTLVMVIGDDESDYDPSIGDCTGDGVEVVG